MASRGARLLRSKREVLAGEFFRLARDALAGRARLDACLREAGRALTVARALDGEAQLASLAQAAARATPVETRRRRVWGVAIAEVIAPRLQRAPDGRGTPPGAWSLSAMEAALRHEEALEILLGIATRELHLARLGEEIRETSRRINALEQLVVPRLDAEVARVDQALEQRAREDVVRVKKFRDRPGRRR